MRTKEGFLALLAELDAAMVELGRVSALNLRAWRRIQDGADDILDGASDFRVGRMQKAREFGILFACKTKNRTS